MLLLPGYARGVFNVFCSPSQTMPEVSLTLFSFYAMLEVSLKIPSLFFTFRLGYEESLGVLPPRYTTRIPPALHCVLPRIPFVGSPAPRVQADVLRCHDVRCVVCTVLHIACSCRKKATLSKGLLHSLEEENKATLRKKDTTIGPEPPKLALPSLFSHKLSRISSSLTQGPGLPFHDDVFISWLAGICTK